jgi:phosphoribosylaminoimidazole-succinocarboxamide synthase|tara:strand:- start:755 stop:1600 length:846 start_codon:yes stop_codon:yes gene_type:complete
MSHVNSDYSLIKQGKVKSAYQSSTNPDNILFDFSDRISAFDVILPTAIPEKGEILCKFAKFFFDNLHVDHHLIDIVDSTQMIVKKLDMIPIECIVRGYLYGGLFERVNNGEIKVDCDNVLATQLSEPIFDPTTKSDIKDEPITESEILSQNIVSEDELNYLKNTSIDIYKKILDMASKSGFLIADLKLEFGKDRSGNILLADSIGPDEFRLWSIDKYEIGKTQESFDKQILRDWLIDSGYKKQLDDARNNKVELPNPPVLPQDLVDLIQERYIIAYENFSK